MLHCKNYIISRLNELVAGTETFLTHFRNLRECYTVQFTVSRLMYELTDIDGLTLKYCAIHENVLE